MIGPRWKKALADIASNPTRTLLVVLSIAVGVFAVGLILGTRDTLSRDLRRDFDATNPLSAAIATDPFDDDFVASLRRAPGVGDAQGSASLTLRARMGPNDTRQIEFIQVDGRERRINMLRSRASPWPPPLHQVALERATLDWLGLEAGDQFIVEDPSGKLRELTVSGSAHYINTPPPTFAGQGYAFATFDTLEWLGGSRGYTTLQFVVAEDRLNRPHVEAVAAEVRARIESSGRKVYGTSIPNPPDSYPMEDGIEVILLLLGVLGALALGLSGFLVTNTLSALVTQQTRQIGIMKALGGRQRQIVGIYLGTVLGYGALALLLGVPLGALAAYGFSKYLARICNLDVSSFAPSLAVIAAECVVGLAVPLLAGLYPVLRGTGITIREAMTLAGGDGGRGPDRVDRLVGRVRGLSRPLLISLRSTVRRKGRLALTLSTLILAGVTFVSVMSVRDSVGATLDDALAYFNYDVDIRLNESYRTERIVAEAEGVMGVAGVQVLAGGRTQRVRPDDTESDNIGLLALPADSPYIRPTLLEGRWLLPEDDNAVVVNSLVLKDEPDVKVGDDLTLKIDGEESTWRVVGTVRGVLTGSFAYVNQPYLWRLTDNAGRASGFWVVGEKHDPASQKALGKAIEARFRAAGMRPTSVETIAFRRESIQGQFDILIVFLLAMAVLLAVVGGLGLMGTMSLNVIERTREIGVMRATGASNAAIRGIFVSEALAIGAFSWLIGAILAVPFSRALSDAVGVAFIQTPLSYRYSPTGVVIWLALVSVLAAAASVLPALAASRLTVRETLTYE